MEGFEYPEQIGDPLQGVHRKIALALLPVEKGRAGRRAEQDELLIHRQTPAIGELEERLVLPIGLNVLFVLMEHALVRTKPARIELLAHIASLAPNESIRRRMLRAKAPEALLEVIKTADTLLAT